MSQQDIFFQYYFKPSRMRENDFFGIFCQNFLGQLKDLHQNLEVEDEDGIVRNFREQDFTDFCILIYQTRQDLIDFSQN